MALCHFFWYLLFLTIIHTVQSYIHSSFTIRRGLSSCILIASSLSKRRTSIGCRAENWTRACLTASRRTTNWATPNPQLNHAAPKLSHAAPPTKPRQCYNVTMPNVTVSNKISAKNRFLHKLSSTTLFSHFKKYKFHRTQQYSIFSLH